MGSPARDTIAEQRAEHLAGHRGLQPNGDDVVMVVKDRMAIAGIPQLILMPHDDDLPVVLGLPLQSPGVHGRRPASDTDRTTIRDTAA